MLANQKDRHNLHQEYLKMQDRSAKKKLRFLCGYWRFDRKYIACCPGEIYHLLRELEPETDLEETP